MEELIIKKTNDGSNTLYVKSLDEHYHSTNGAIVEAMCVYINNGFDSCETNPIRIFEVGFGTGLNAFLTAKRAEENRKKTLYFSIEKRPLPEEVTEQLNYATTDEEKSLFISIHSCEWNRQCEITPYFAITKIEADLTSYTPEGIYDLIYFDAFGPDKQPEMWSTEIFDKMASITSDGSIFTTYSAKGDVKRNLRRIGFTVKLLPGPPGKRHVIRAFKNSCEMI